MKIAVIDTTIGTDLIGGAHTFLAEMIKRLVDNGHDVHFVTRGEPTEKVRRQVEDSNAKLYLRVWNENDLIDDSGPVLAKWVNDLAPDIFLISASGDMGWVVLPLLDPKIATLTIGHSDSETFYMPARHYARFLTGAVGVSDEICETYVRSCGIAHDRAVWIPYGVTASEAAPEETGQGPLKLIYVGRLAEPDKKVSDLIRICKRLRNHDLAFSLTVVGDGPMRPQFDMELAQEIISGKANMLGWIENSQLLEHLRGSDICLLVSESEGFCIALVEAMANGCCPVVTDIRSGNKQLVCDGENGFVVPIGDVDAFVDKIRYLSESRDKLLEFRQNAWETGRQYSVERMVESYEQAFARAIEVARTNPRTPDPDFPLMESCRSKYPLWLRRLKAKARSFARE